ncbi:hypothetical protein V2J09_001226 [Rumex salicifolius]
MEAKGNSGQYSKLMKPQSKQDPSLVVPSRTGMLIAYAPAFLCGVASFFVFPDEGLRFLLLRLALTLHFLKRLLEVMSIHNYSGSMALETVKQIPWVYFLATFLAIYTQHISRESPQPAIDLKFIGSAKVYGGVMEAKGNNVQYSKLMKPQSKQHPNLVVPSRTGMLIAYAPAFLCGVASFFVFPDEGLRFLLLRLALTLHFLKRLLEVMFIHNYSGSMALDSVKVIPLGYFLATLLTIYTQHLCHESPQPAIDLKFIGSAVFLVGISGNFYHHYLLSTLRSKGEKEYKIPTGGLFSLVICPHYLFEVLGFWGIAFIAQTPITLTGAMGTSAYLIGRSFATRKWYVSKFEDFPHHVKAIIPCVF